MVGYLKGSSALKTFSKIRSFLSKYLKNHDLVAIFNDTEPITIQLSLSLKFSSP